MTASKFALTSKRNQSNLTANSHFDCFMSARGKAVGEWWSCGQRAGVRYGKEDELQHWTQGGQVVDGREVRYRPRVTV